MAERRLDTRLGRDRRSRRRRALGRHRRLGLRQRARPALGRSGRLEARGQLGPVVRRGGACTQGLQAGAGARADRHAVVGRTGRTALGRGSGQVCHRRHGRSGSDHGGGGGLSLRRMAGQGPRPTDLCGCLQPQRGLQGTIGRKSSFGGQPVGRKNRAIAARLRPFHRTRGTTGLPRESRFPQGRQSRTGFGGGQRAGC